MTRFIAAIFASTFAIAGSVQAATFSVENIGTLSCDTCRIIQSGDYNMADGHTGTTFPDAGSFVDEGDDGALLTLYMIDPDNSNPLNEVGNLNVLLGGGDSSLVSTPPPTYLDTPIDPEGWEDTRVEGDDLEPSLSFDALTWVIFKFGGGGTTTGGDVLFVQVIGDLSYTGRALSHYMNGGSEIPIPASLPLMLLGLGGLGIMHRRRRRA